MRRCPPRACLAGRVGHRRVCGRPGACLRVLCVCTWPAADALRCAHAGVRECAGASVAPDSCREVPRTRLHDPAGRFHRTTVADARYALAIASDALTGWEAPLQVCSAPIEGRTRWPATYLLPRYRCALAGWRLRVFGQITERGWQSHSPQHGPLVLGSAHDSSALVTTAPSTQLKIACYGLAAPSAYACTGSTAQQLAH